MIKLRVVYKWSKEDKKMMYFPQYRGWCFWNYFSTYVSYSEGSFSYINRFDTMKELKDWMKEEKKMADIIKEKKNIKKDNTVKIFYI